MGRATVLVLFFIGLLSACASLQQSAKVQWAGTYSVTSITRIPDAESLTGMRNEIQGARSVRDSGQVEGKLGDHIGVGYRLVGGTPGEKILLRAAVTYPNGGLTNPDNGRTLQHREWDQTCVVGKQCVIGFFFREPWELKAGTWEFEAWYGSNRLFQEQIEVVIPSNDQLVRRAIDSSRPAANYVRELEKSSPAHFQRRFVAGQRAGEFQPYVTECLRKIKVFAEANYPDEARGTLYGHVHATFALARNGMIDYAIVERSSDHKALDDFVIKAIKLAAPFPPFPPGSLNEVDQLVVTQVFSFVKAEPSDSVQSERESR
ncbi:TonB family protein [Propionivibrio soli]|uniref:TonB family protein n=1 Tax=Propionivibrio soli TaxID=2976531 RepID=UPI0021E94B08|nr:TonB family protein [Propionivibrio soli]